MSNSDKENEKSQQVMLIYSKYINKKIKAHIQDGRIFEGILVATDKFANIILQDVMEYIIIGI